MKFVIIILLLLLVVFLSLQCNPHQLRFKNKEVRDTYTSLVEELGPPQVLINQEDGFAMWFLNSKPFTEVILKDERYFHPLRNDYDHLYTTIAIKVPEDKLYFVSQLLSAFCNQETNELTVRCNSLAENKNHIYWIVGKIVDKTISNDSELIDSINRINNTEYFFPKEHKPIPVIP